MFLLSFIFFLFRSLQFLDPDFGWHLQAGKQILTGGIAVNDPFSYTMPSFPFVNHEWLYDLIIARIFSMTGFFGLSMTFTLLGVLILFLTTRNTSLKIVKLTASVLLITALEPMFGIAPRVISWLLFSLTLYLVLNKNVWVKYWCAVPLIVLLWTNLHGTFILGLGILVIIFVTRSLVEQKFKSKEFFILLISSFATLINPYGTKLWWMVYLTVTDQLLKTRIAEWQPTYIALTHIPFVVFFIFSLTLTCLIKYRTKFKKEEIALNIVFFISGLLAFRNINYWILVTLPMISRGINYFYTNLEKIKNGQKRLLLSLKYVFVCALVAFVVQYSITTYRLHKKFSENTFYPKNAIIYLNENIPKGEIFAEYNWGGYLIWRLPQKKVFISGLMPVWKNPNAPKGESKDAMQDYLNITTGNVDYKVHFEKYGIDTVLLANKNSQTIKLRQSLENDGWKVVYSDEVATIFML